MSWYAILILLLNLLIQELPGIVAAVAEWVKRWLNPDQVTFGADSFGADGSLDEFKRAVRERLTALLSSTTGPLRRAMLAFVIKHVSDAIIEKLYRLVVGSTPMPAFSAAYSEDLEEFCAALESAAEEK